MFNKLLPLVALVIVACGGGNGSSPPQAPHPQTTISGLVFASNAFTSGTVNAYSFASGVQGAALATTTINGAGEYTLNVPASSGAVLLVAESGCYIETGIPWSAAANNAPSVTLAITASVCFSLTPSKLLSAAVVLPATTTTLVAAITPFTHAARGLAEYKIRNGNAVTLAVNDAHNQLSSWAGLDILATLPASPIRSSTVSDPLVYGSLLGGIPSWLLNVATSAPAVFGVDDLTALAFADAMKSDLAQDGILNGTGRNALGNVVALMVGNSAMTTTIYRHQLAFYAVIRIRGETEGALGATLAEQSAIVGFLPAFVAYNDAVNSLLGGSAIVPLDEGGPVVTILGPSPGATLTLNDGMSGRAHDSVGIPSQGTIMLIDGVEITPFVNQYLPNHFINTTIFANGSHTLTIKATNNLGHVSTDSVTVTFFN